MEAQQSQTRTVAGTISGTLLSLFANIHPDDLVKTTVLAVIGAIASFLVSLVLRWVVRRLKAK